MSDIGASEKNAIVDGPFGSNLKVSDYVENGPVPVLTTKNLTGDYSNVRYITQDKFEELKRSEVRPNDILMAKIGSCGKTGIYPVNMPSAIIPANLMKITVHPEVEQKYVYYYFDSLQFQSHLRKITKATAQPAFGVTNFKKLPFPLAPPEQQKRIVAKIEELFSHIDAGIEALKKAKQLLKQYRQSVLKAAVTGELTKEWREANKDKFEAASQLLERILKERRQKWEEQQLEQFKAKGKMPKDDKWEEKYKDGLEANSTDIEEIASYVIPEGWQLMTADQLTYFLTDGEHATPPRTDEGIPLLSARNVQNGWLSFEKIDHVTEETHEKLCERLKVEHGDVLLSCSGTVGRSCVAPENSKFSLVRSVAVLRPVLDNGAFMSLCFRSGMLQAQIERKKTQTAQANIFQGKIKTLIFPVPAIDEQEEIVRQVEEKLESINRLDSELDIQVIKAEKNKQSVLASAFCGKLQ